MSSVMADHWTLVHSSLLTYSTGILYNGKLCQGVDNIAIAVNDFLENVQASNIFSLHVLHLHNHILLHHS